MKSEGLTLLVSIWIGLTCNTGYWSVVAASNPTGALPTPLYFFSVALLTIGLIYLVLLIFAVGYLTRVVLSLALIVSAAAGYFTAKFGILFDSDMLVNVIETNPAEASELVSLPLVATVVVLGVLPAILIWRLPLSRRPIQTASLHRAVAIILAFALIGGPLLYSQKEIFSLARNHREIRHMIAPIDVMAAAYVYQRDRLEAPSAYRHVALDAVRSEAHAENERPTVHVIVVGETARAANFGLNGYSKNTNPQLQQRSDITYIQATSCGTATATSLPCMFSVDGRSAFDRDTSRNQDNLLDIAARAGYAVYWVDNGNGCKGVCARIDSQDVHLSDVEDICPSGECYDEILDHALRALLPKINGDTLIVLHQLGSHGPAYYRRYPDEFRTFRPDCRSPNLGDCSDQEIVNSYDNTILYTDHVIAAAIDALASQSKEIDSSLIYLSDHGESLGERGAYLHGMPYRFAPDEQTHIPMIIWTSAEADQSQGIGPHCISRSRSRQVSQDNLFHTELGLLGIDTAVYDPALDIFSTCRSNSGPAAVNAL